MKRLLCCLAMVAVAAGCSRKSSGPLQLGYFPNITHAQAIVGVREGVFARELDGRQMKARVFNAGPSAMEALLARELDVAYVGPGPAISAFVRSGGKVKVIAGAAAGGAGLVVRDIKSINELGGVSVAVPQIGNTQDIALRHWLRANGRKTQDAGGDVTVTPMANPEIVNLFRQGLLKAAWVPEPWLSTLLEEGGTLLVDETSLWPGGRFPTTVLLVTNEALANRREDVKAILRAHVQLTQSAKRNPLRFRGQVEDGFAALTGKRLPEEVAAMAFGRLDLTVDPMEDQLATDARHAADLGYLPNANVAGMVDRSLLEEVMPHRGSGVGGSGPDPAE